jgi:hypothetical protein
VQWRLCLSLQIVAPLILFIGSPWLPESPRWLISKSKERHALEILQKLHSRPDDPSGLAAKEEFYQISKQIELENATGVHGVWGMLKRASYRKRIYSGLLVQYVSISSRLVGLLLTRSADAPPNPRVCS